METNPALFQDLYKRQAPGLFRLALGLTGHGDEAEDQGIPLDEIVEADPGEDPGVRGRFSASPL